MHKINKTAVAFLRRYATLFIKKTQYLLSRLRMNSLWRRTILNGLRLRSGHVQRKKYFKFRVCRALRSAPNAIFTGGVVAGNGSCCACSPGGAVAQRLRGCKSAEPEKTVKRSSRRTGVNLQFFPVEPSSLGLKGASSPFFVAPARRNRCDLAVLNAQHLLRKPVCDLKAPLGLSCLAGTAALFFSFGVKREHPRATTSCPTFMCRRSFFVELTRNH